MTPEQQERLKQIRERAEKYVTGTVYAEVYHEDVNTLLFLLDSQGAPGVTVSTLVGYEAGLKDGEDSMRSACVEKVKGVLDGLVIELPAQPDAYLRGQGWNSALARAKNEIVPELEAVTLDQQESK